jgi:hypothetical protein
VLHGFSSSSDDESTRNLSPADAGMIPSMAELPRKSSDSREKKPRQSGGAFTITRFGSDIDSGCQFAVN